MRARKSSNDGTGRELLKSMGVIAAGTASLTAAGVSSLARWAAKRHREQVAEHARQLAAQAEAAAVAAAASAPATQHARELVTAELARRVTTDALCLEDMADLVIRAHAVETIGQLAAIVDANPRELATPPPRPIRLVRPALLVVVGVLSAVVGVVIGAVLL
jgi:hypothetical protein